MDYAETLSSSGHMEQALSAIEEAVAIGRHLTSADPKRHSRALARSLMVLSFNLFGLDRPAEAEAVGAEAVAIWRDLTSVDPVRSRPNLARALGNLGLILSDLDRSSDALIVEQEAADIFRELAAADPGW